MPPKSKRHTATTTALSAILKGLDKLKGEYEEAFKSGGDEARFSTGFLSLDAITGGGIVEGRIIEAFGNEGTGKSTLALQVCPHSMEPGQVAVYLDFEGSFMPEWAGVMSGMKVLHLEDAHEMPKHADKKILLWTQPGSLEEGVNLIFSLSELFEERLRFIIIDSIAMMTPKAWLEGSQEDKTIGELARGMSKFLNIATSVLRKRKTTLWCVNQVRTVIGKFVPFGGDPSESAGGRALKFAATQRFKMSMGERHDWKAMLPKGSHSAYIKVEKNKTSPDRKGTTKLVLWPGKGFSPEVELIELMVQNGVLTNGGPGTYRYGEKVMPKVDILVALTQPGENGEDKREQVREMFMTKLREKVPDGRYELDIGGMD